MCSTPVLTTSLIVSKPADPKCNRDSTIQDPDDIEFELIRIDEFSIRRLRKSTPDKCRKRMDREIEDWMKPESGK